MFLNVLMDYEHAPIHVGITVYDLIPYLEAVSLSIEEGLIITT
jgi:hypothetical protein